MKLFRLWERRRKKGLRNRDQELCAMILCLVGSRARCRLLVLTALLAALAVFPAAAENPDNPAKAEEFFFQ